jgi:hypothetical protein
VTKDELVRMGEVSARLDAAATSAAQMVLGEIPLDGTPILGLIEAARLQLRKATEQ